MKEVSLCRLTQEQRIEVFAGRFKRYALGLCGTGTIKSLDEIAEILTKSKIVDTIQEGRAMVPKLANFRKGIQYGFPIFCQSKYIKLEHVKVKGIEKDDLYQISTYVILSD